jgi:hypothetical protein
MKTVWCSLVAAVALALATTPSGAAQADPVTVLQQVNAAFNRNDQQAALAGFTDDTIVIGGPCGGAPAGRCVGKQMLEQSVHAGGPVQVTMLDPQVIGDGNVVTFRFEERFGWPPQATAMGVERFIEIGTAVITGGQVSRLALVPDVTDSQTLIVLRVLATLDEVPDS